MCPKNAFQCVLVILAGNEKVAKGLNPNEPAMQGIAQSLIGFGLVFVAPAFRRTIQNLIPVLFPLFTPCEGPLADRAYLLGQVVFIDHFHESIIENFERLAHPSRAGI